ncbi:MAG: hypothetical protein L6262_03045 [Weeksellaceae bacterium]|nr:hypothetical protein [Weeksellaceae bacterium]
MGGTTENPSCVSDGSGNPGIRVGQSFGMRNCSGRSDPGGWNLALARDTPR